MELLPIAYFLLFLATLTWFLATTLSSSSTPKRVPPNTNIPKAYPIIGSIFAIAANKHRRIHWISDILLSSPSSSTFTLRRSLGSRQIFTADPAIVHHILKSNFPTYQKGPTLNRALGDFLGDGIFNSDGDNWKFQRQLSSHEFNTRSLRNFVETVVDAELSNRLIPILSATCNHTNTNATNTCDLQDILQRFAFDNICKIAFGYDPEYLLPSLPTTTFAKAFDDATRISSERFNSAVPLVWKIKKILNIGSENRLRTAVSEVRGLAKKIVEEKKRELEEKKTLQSVDLLSRFLVSGQNDESFVTDIVISFILAGRDTTSAALTWFFWLLASHPHVEEEVVSEIIQKNHVDGSSVYEELKDMVYTHAALCESMRLYPPVPVDTKEAANDDVLPDGTFVKKGTRLAYHIFAMGRSERIWGADWADFRPERWLRRDGEGKWAFVGVDPYSYTVFQAGPRVCLGKEMAFLQMKRVVAGILREFRVVPAVAEGVVPEYTGYLTSLMKGGFPVKIEKRR
ncbi:cytochrome P450 94A2-like [Arachis stenosperma]|uniref:cytochrome P450 94A2-like n=1 Tax=Arachis stenosperma TaxID=217475 RepID=UPI0025AD991D|nr:cytochrome P450 94A2-like [Arachis stenosperma]